MREFLNEPWIQVICILILVVVCSYMIGRLFTKGILHELDLYLGNKFVNYINKHSKKDEKEENQ